MMARRSAVPVVSMTCNNFSILIFLLITTQLCFAQNEKISSPPAAYALDGKPLYSKEPGAGLLQKLQQYREEFQSDSTDADNIIWYGRFMAYAGHYQKAIDIFSRGMDLFPDDARFLRHRGHRYITIRKFDQAIVDLEEAARLIQDQPDMIEPDGMPNARNIPVSTLHGNIYYHLGLGYYLKHDFYKALQAYLKCLHSTQNDDNLVSATHWIYTIMCRQGKKEQAIPYLQPVADTLDVIENLSYHRLCLLYKGDLAVSDVRHGLEPGPARDAVDYGIARWYACQGESARANEILNEILSQPEWASFGYIAAEADVANFK